MEVQTGDIRRLARIGPPGTELRTAQRVTLGTGEHKRVRGGPDVLGQVIDEDGNQVLRDLDRPAAATAFIININR